MKRLVVLTSVNKQTSSSRAYLALSVPWLFLIVLATSLPMIAQSAEWHRFSSDSGKVSFSFPDPGTVINQKGYSDLYYDDASLSASFSRHEYLDPRKYLKEYKTPANETVSDLSSDKKIIIKRFDSRIEGGRWSKIMLASSCCWYQFTVATTTGHEDLIDKYLESIVFDGIALLSQKPQASSPEESVQKLPSSPMVTKMLNKRCDVGSVPVRFDVQDHDKGQSTDAPKSAAAFPVARQLTLLTKPKAEGMPIGATVLLKVVFGADGCIGSIVVLKGGRDAVAAAVKAAVGIKFIPVMIAGKFVEVTKSVEYATY